MRTSLKQIGLIAIFAVPLVAGCATMTPGPAAFQRMDYGPEAFARIRDSLITRRVSEASRGEAPRVRIIPPSVQAANTVNAIIEVSRDAYVLVVATDLDGEVRVVFPELPGQTGFLKGSARYNLPQFFGGFGPTGLAQYGRSAFSVEPVNRYAALGSIVAIASDQPLQLARIVNRDGNWDQAALERLVYGRSPSMAGYSLGTELTLADNGFDTAFSGFSQSIASSLSANAAVGASLCESGFANSRSANNPLNAMYYDGPRTSFFESNGTRYATTVLGNPCTGFQTRTVPVGPATPTTTGDSASGARIPAADPGTAGARVRNGPQGFRPPDGPGALPQQRDTDANLRAQSENERERARVDAAERASRRPMTPTEQRPMPEPMRAAPPQVREAPTTPPPAPPAAPSEPPAGKPRKE